MPSLFLSKILKFAKIYIFPVALYGRETRSLILFAEHRKRVFDSKMMRKIMGLRRRR